MRAGPHLHRGGVKSLQRVGRLRSDRRLSERSTAYDAQSRLGPSRARHAVACTLNEAQSLHPLTAKLQVRSSLPFRSPLASSPGLSRRRPCPDPDPALQRPPHVNA